MNGLPSALRASIKDAVQNRTRRLYSVLSMHLTPSGLASLCFTIQNRSVRFCVKPRVLLGAIHVTTRDGGNADYAGAIICHLALRASIAGNTVQDNSLLSCHTLWDRHKKSPTSFEVGLYYMWRPQGDSNPCCRRERAVS